MLAKQSYYTPRGQIKYKNCSKILCEWW